MAIVLGLPPRRRVQQGRSDTNGAVLVESANMCAKIAIIENEFGEQGIDDALLAKNTREHVEEEIIEMMNGCICCTVRQDLVEVGEQWSPQATAGYSRPQFVQRSLIVHCSRLHCPAPPCEKRWPSAPDANMVHAARSVNW